MLSIISVIQRKFFRLFSFSSLVFVLFIYSCSQPNRESQWMNIPRDSSAIGKQTRLDTISQSKVDSVLNRDSVSAK